MSHGVSDIAGWWLHPLFSAQKWSFFPIYWFCLFCASHLLLNSQIFSTLTCSCGFTIKLEGRLIPLFLSSRTVLGLFLSENIDAGKMPGCHVHWLLEELSSETALLSWKISSWFSFAGENVEKLAAVGHIWMIVTVGLFFHCSLSWGTCRFYCIWSLVGTAAAGVQLVFVVSHLYHCVQKLNTVPLDMPGPSQKNHKWPWTDPFLKLLLFLFPSSTFLSYQSGKVQLVLFLLAALCLVQVEEKGSWVINQEERDVHSSSRAVLLALGCLPGRTFQSILQGDQAFWRVFSSFFFFSFSCPCICARWFNESLPQQEWCAGAFSCWMQLIHGRFSLNSCIRWCHAEPYCIQAIFLQCSLSFNGNKAHPLLLCDAFVLYRLHWNSHFYNYYSL